ncbi:MAG: RIP metalloprotease RseP, partial [Pseudomonas sp.]
MNMLYMVCGLLVALGVLVTFHEFGHFWVARRCGVKVLRFSVGFGTPLVRWHDRHGTEFVVAAIPLGGYVKMLDERETDAHIATADLPFAFNRKPVLQRIAIVSAGPIANFLLAILFFWVLAMMGSQQVRPVIGAVEPQSLAAQAGLAAGQEIVAVDGERTSGWSVIGLQLVRRLGETGQISIQVLEPGATAETNHTVQLQAWLKGAEEPDPISSLGIRPWRPVLEPVLATLDPEGPAQAAGLKVGDRLLSLDGAALTDWQQLVDGVRPRAGQRVVLAVQRDGQQIDVPVTLASKGNDKAHAGYLGAGVQGGEWPADMLREVSFG